MQGCKTPAVLRAGVPPGIARDLPRSVWALQAGMAVNALGNGLATPFLLIYLHSVRGFSVRTVGLVPLTQYAVAIVAGIAAGTVVDRIGGRTTAAASMIALAGGFVGYPFVHEPWQAFALASSVGVGTGAFWPSFGALIATLVPPERRHVSAAVQRIAMNVGFGLGGLAGGLVAATSHPGTFTVLFVLNAATYLVFGAVFALLRLPAAAVEYASLRPPSYRAVVRDRAFVATIAIGTVFAAAGIAQMNSILPVFARSYVHVTETWIGVIVLFNTLTIVLVQLPVTRAVEGRRRMAAFAAIGLLWASCWCVALASSFAPVGLATALLVAIAIVFGLGEAVLAVVSYPLVADLAPDRLRGRYLALSAITLQLGYGVGPAVGGLLLGVSASVLWSVAAALCAGAAIAALAVEPVLPRSVRTTPARAEVVTTG